MTEQQKYLDLTDFIEGGYLHEVNRLVLHPVGLALACVPDAQGRLSLIGIWDERDALGGIISTELDQDKIDNVATAIAERSKWRQSRFGFEAHIQDRDLSKNAYEEAHHRHFDEKGKQITDDVPTKKPSRKRSTGTKSSAD